MEQVRHDAAFVFGVIESRYHLRKMPIMRSNVEWDGHEDEYVNRCIEMLIDEGVLEDHNGVLKPVGNVSAMITGN